MNEKSRTVSRLVWSLVLSLSLAVWSAGLLAQSAPASQFLFPHFVSYPEESTGIAIFNPASNAATVTLTLRWPDGSLVTEVMNPTTLTVPGRGQVARMAGELFGSPVNLDASLEITSTTPGLVAYYQAFDPASTVLDGSDAPQAAISLVFPVIPGPTEGIAEIDFVNPNIRDTAVELKAWHLDGHLMGTATIQVPGQGIYRNLAPGIFPAGTDLRGLSHITATSKPRNVLSAAQTVAGTSLFAGFTSYASSGGSIDWAALNARPVAETTNTGAFSYFRTGGKYASTLGLVNIEPVSVTATVTAVANNGVILGSQTVSLPAQGGWRAPLQNLIAALGSNAQEGWLLVQASGRITGALVYGRNDAGSLTALPLQKTPKFEFVFPQVVQGFGYTTEITLVNPTPNTSYARVWIVGADGTTMATNQVALSPSQRLSAALNQLIPEMDDQCGGVVYVRASEVLFATAAIWSDSGSIASNFTPQDVTFYPAPLTNFAVTGRVFFNERPEPGLRVVLTGPVGKMATTDESGIYQFSNLPAGKYLLMVDQPGLQFVPDQASFEITTESWRQDFQAFTDDNGILVQPSSVPVTSANTTISIFGQDFNNASEVFAGVIRLQTTFIDATHLSAVVPGYLTQTAANFDIVVATTHPDGSRIISPPYPFAAYQARPILDGLVIPDTIVEGGVGHHIILQGSGFLEGARVKINGLSDGLQVNVIDDTEIQVYVPASYFVSGGAYPVVVVNPLPANVESNLQLLPVYFLPPSVENIYPVSTPARIEVGAGPMNLDVMGYGFRRGAVVLFNGTPLVTTYCEVDSYCLSVHLFAKVPAEALMKAGFAKIEVRNPDPSLANSQAQYLRIEGLQPTITSVQPGSATLLDTPFAVAMPIIINGTNFSTETVIRVYKADEEPPDAFSKSKLEWISSTQLLVIVDMTYPDSIGQWKVQVANPPPGGGLSDAVGFFITDGSFVANPFLISLSPRIVAAGGPAFTLTVNGTNFKPGSVIYLNYVPLVTTVVSDRQLRAEVPSTLIYSAGRRPVSVLNPDTGGTSNRLFLEIR